MIINNKNRGFDLNLKEINMLTSRQKNLSFSGGHIVMDRMMIPSYSPNAVSATVGQHFPWEEDVEVMTTPDIDPSFFDSDPFKKLSAAQTSNPMDFLTDENLMMNNQYFMTASEDSSQQSIQQTLDDNPFIDLSQLINQNNSDSNCLKESESMVSPNDVLQSQYIPSTSAPVLHYLQPKPVESIASIITNNTSLIDSIISQSSAQESLTQFSSPSHSSSQSYSPVLLSSTPTVISQYTTNPSPTPSPALSYTSSQSSHSTLVSGDVINSDTNTTIDSLMDSIDTKPELSFLQPTVINDHLYTLPSTSTSRSRRKTSTDNKDKYLTVRKKNNMASKKSRVTKRDKQKIMEEQIQNYVEDNANCKRMIEQMEREIEWCKNYLFKKVVASASS